MTPKEIEADFQIAWESYWHHETTKTGQQKQWNRMWLDVNEACSNLIKNKAKGLVIPDFDGKVTDSVLLVMNKLANGTRPKRLSSFCYLYCIGVIYNRKLQKEERNISLESWIEYNWDED